MYRDATSRKIITVFVLLNFCFMMFSCDKVIKQQSKEVSLKGKEITEKLGGKLKRNFACCKSKETLVKAYSINPQSSKTLTLKNKISNYLKNHKQKLSKKKIEPGKPQINKSIIYEDNDTRNEVLVTPIQNNKPNISERIYTSYNSETNEIGNNTFFYRAETNLTQTELEQVKNDPTPELKNKTELSLVVKDKNGITIFKSDSILKDKDNLKKLRLAAGCFGDCFKKVLSDLPWYMLTICMIQPIPCVIGISITCSLHCWVYDGRYM